MIRHHNGKEFVRAVQNLVPLEGYAGVIDIDYAPQNTASPAIEPVIAGTTVPVAPKPANNTPIVITPTDDSASRT